MAGEAMQPTGTKAAHFNACAMGSCVTTLKHVMDAKPHTNWSMPYSGNCSTTQKLAAYSDSSLRVMCACKRRCANHCAKS